MTMIVCCIIFLRYIRYVIIDRNNHSQQSCLYYAVNSKCLRSFHESGVSHNGGTNTIFLVEELVSV